jgi:hypothetical protein
MKRYWSAIQSENYKTKNAWTCLWDMMYYFPM